MFRFFPQNARFPDSAEQETRCNIPAVFMSRFANIAIFIAHLMGCYLVVEWTVCRRFERGCQMDLKDVFFSSAKGVPNRNDMPDKAVFRLPDVFPIQGKLCNSIDPFEKKFCGVGEILRDKEAARIEPVAEFKFSHLFDIVRIKRIRNDSGAEKITFNVARYFRFYCGKLECRRIPGKSPFPVQRYDSVHVTGPW